MSEQRFCPKCRKTMADINFYKRRNGEFFDLCKACATLHINNFEPDTYTWLLKDLDFPYVPSEWDTLRDRAYQKDPYKMTGMTVIGKYISKMRLKNWKEFGWADSDMLVEQQAAKAALYGSNAQKAEAQMKEMEEAYKRGEINESQWLTYKGYAAPEPGGCVPPSEEAPVSQPSAYPVNENPFEQVELPDVHENLTEEDKVYLALKWGRLYSADEWVTMEKKYLEYEQSFDLHNADLISGTIQLCKLDLKCNLALDSGDIDSYSKLARASDSLRKSLKFTEAQRKEDKASDFSCYGLLVSFAEEYNDEDYIRPIDLSVDRDIVDKDIHDIKNHTQTLIKEDPAVYKMIEQYIKKREAMEEENARNAAGDIEINDKDLKEYNDNIEAQRAEDEEDDDE